MNLLLLIILFLVVVAMLSWRPRRGTYPPQSELSSGESEPIFIAAGAMKPRKKFYRHDLLILLLVFVIILLAASPS